MFSERSNNLRSCYFLTIWSCTIPSLNTAVIITLFVLFLLLDCNQVVLVSGQTNNEPVNINWIFSLPWDVSNTLRAPFGGPVSLALTGFMACILLFGLLLAPVNYILGYPPRIYHVYRKGGIFGRSFDSDLQHSFPSTQNYSYYQANNDNHGFNDDNYGESFDMADILVHLFHSVRSTTQVVFDREEDFSSRNGNYVTTGRELALASDNSFKAPGFLESIFLLVPEAEDEECKQLMVCHAHGFLQYLPEMIPKLFKILSKHFITIPDTYKEAIVLGLEDQGLCEKVYTGCRKDLFQLVRGSVGLIRRKIVKFMPEGTKDIWQAFYSHYAGGGKY